MQIGFAWCSIQSQEISYMRQPDNPDVEIVSGILRRTAPSRPGSRSMLMERRRYTQTSPSLHNSLPLNVYQTSIVEHR